MQIRKSRWSRVYESAEEELVELLERKHISAHRWTAEEDEDMVTRQFAAETRLWCAEGQLVCTIMGRAYSLQAGDVLEIPAKLGCRIRVGFGGCICYESSATEKTLL